MSRTNLVFLLFFALIGALLFIQYLGYSRERGRVVMCQKRLMLLGRAGQEYTLNAGHYPPGTLGQPDGVSSRKWAEPLGEFGWQRVPNTSVLAFLHPFLESQSATTLGSESFSFDQTNFNWSEYTSNLTSTEQGFQTEFAFLCPADAGSIFPADVKFVCATQPVSVDDTEEIDKEDFGLQYWPGEKPLGAANYLGNGGVSGERCNIPETVLAGFIGPFRSRSRTTPNMVIDGQSVTIMIGEGIGSSKDGLTTERFAWAKGGIGIIRGDLPPVALDDDKAIDAAKYLGNSRQASSRGFSSRHVAGVNFVMLGGEFQLVTRDVSPMILFALAGISDGEE